MTNKSLIEAAGTFLEKQTYGSLIPETRKLWEAWLVAFAEQHASDLVADREARIAELEAALEHYADEKNWRCSQEYEEGHYCSQTQWSSCDSRKYFDDDGHNIAREALNKQHSPGEK